MHHNTADQYCRLSPFYSVDERVKLLSAIIFIILISFVTDLVVGAFAFGYVILLTVISRVPVAHIGRMYLSAVPFILFSVISLYLYSSPGVALAMFMRISAAVAMLLLLAATTPLFSIVKAMRYFRMPPLLAVLVMFIYRYVFLIWDEMEKMQMARKARGFTGGRHILDGEAMRVISLTAGMVLLRSYRRAQRVQESLSLRNFSIDGMPLDFSLLQTHDVLYILSVIGAAVVLFVTGGVHQW